MLPLVVLVRLAKHDGRKVIRRERRVIAAATEAVFTRHQANRVRRHVGPRHPLDVARQRPMRRILRAQRVDLHALAVDDAVAAEAAAHDVVVEVRFDDALRVAQRRGMRHRANQSLFLSGPRHEHQCRIEIDTALGEYPRQLHRERRTAAIVVRARRIGVVVDRGTHQWHTRRRTGGGGRRVSTRRTSRVDGVVVTGDVHAARALARQHRHYVH